MLGCISPDSESFLEPPARKDPSVVQKSETTSNKDTHVDSDEIGDDLGPVKKSPLVEKEVGEDAMREADRILADTKEDEALVSDQVFAEIGLTIQMKPGEARKVDTVFLFVIKRGGSPIKRWCECPFLTTTKALENTWFFQTYLNLPKRFEMIHPDVDATSLQC